MSFLDRLYIEYLTAYKFFRKKLDRRTMVGRDIKRQTAALKDYAHDINEVTRFRDADSGPFCLFVHYEPDGRVSASVARVLEALQARGVNTILLSNLKVAEAQRDFFSATCHSLVERGNRGYDFGAYKDGVFHMKDKGYAPSRLLFLNDSVFYSSKGLDHFLDALLGEEDAVGAFENWGEGYHLQSFALSVSSLVFESSAFAGFWRDYLPIGNRIHAIENGEKRLSDAILSASRSSRVIYTAKRLFQALAEDGNAGSVQPVHLPIMWRKEFIADSAEIADDDPQANEKRARLITDLVNVTSPIHSGAYLFPRYLECPLFKKDLVYRERFKFWELESWMHDLLSDAECAEFLTMIRRRGDAKRLNPMERRRYNIGVK